MMTPQRHVANIVLTAVYGGTDTSLADGHLPEFLVREARAFTEGAESAAAACDLAARVMARLVVKIKEVCEALQVERDRLIAERTA